MDDRMRCSWGSIDADPIMRVYHDREWGVPVHDDQKHFEFLLLEGAQAGLSWSTILHRRAGYAKAFRQFDPTKIARFDAERITQLMLDPGIIRNRLKIESAVRNARAFLGVQDEFGSFDTYAWRFVGGKPRQNRWNALRNIPPTSRESDEFSRDLKERGFNFVGSTIIYAHMQAVGMVNDHVVGCYRHQEVARMAPRPSTSTGR
jgi:DNA-3-methyladenine glycosylase I